MMSRLLTSISGRPASSVLIGFSGSLASQRIAVRVCPLGAGGADGLARLFDGALPAWLNF